MCIRDRGVALPLRTLPRSSGQRHRWTTLLPPWRTAVKEPLLAYNTFKSNETKTYVNNKCKYLRSCVDQQKIPVSKTGQGKRWGFLHQSATSTRSRRSVHLSLYCTYRVLARPNERIRMSLRRRLLDGTELSSHVRYISRSCQGTLPPLKLQATRGFLSPTRPQRINYTDRHPT